MKLFNTNIIEWSRVVRSLFQSNEVSPWFVAPKTFYAKLDSVIIFLSKDSCVCKLLYFVILPAIDVSIFSRASIRVSDSMSVRTAVFRSLFVS